MIKSRFFGNTTPKHDPETNNSGSLTDIPKGSFTSIFEQTSHLADTSWIDALRPGPYTEPVYFAKGLIDSHNMYYGGKLVIPVYGEYIYQIKGMPVAKSQFNVGDEIGHELVFLFRIGLGK